MRRVLRGWAGAEGPGAFRREACPPGPPWRFRTQPCHSSGGVGRAAVARGGNPAARRVGPAGCPHNIGGRSRCGPGGQVAVRRRVWRRPSACRRRCAPHRQTRAGATTRIEVDRQGRAWPVSARADGIRRRVRGGETGTSPGGGHRPRRPGLPGQAEPGDGASPQPARPGGDRPSSGPDHSLRRRDRGLEWRLGSEPGRGWQGARRRQGSHQPGSGRPAGQVPRRACAGSRSVVIRRRRWPGQGRYRRLTLEVVRPAGSGRRRVLATARPALEQTPVSSSRRPDRCGGSARVPRPCRWGRLACRRRRTGRPAG